MAALTEHALRGGVLFSARGAGAWASSHALATLVTIESHERALAVADQLEDAARAQGSVANVLTADAYRGWIPVRLGDLSAAEELLRPVADTAAANGILLLLVNLLWIMGDVILERPSQDEMAGLVERLELPAAFADAAGGAWHLSIRGRLRAMRGARGAAEHDLRAAARIFAGLGFGPMHDPWRSSLALTLSAASADEARALVDEELALANATGSARARGVALRASGLLEGGDDGVELLRESVAVLADSPSRYEHARALVELGGALRRAGRRADAREPLESGIELAYFSGAERLVARAREELLAAGARPRQIVRSGFTGLTASERRIVRLAVEGRSNPEIAQTLYLSVKTIETHLSNAYRKLDLSGPGARRRLSALVAQAASR